MGCYECEDPGHIGKYCPQRAKRLQYEALKREKLDAAKSFASVPTQVGTPYCEKCGRYEHATYEHDDIMAELAETRNAVSFITYTEPATHPHPQGNPAFNQPVGDDKRPPYCNNCGDNHPLDARCPPEPADPSGWADATARLSASRIGTVGKTDAASPARRR